MIPLELNGDTIHEPAKDIPIENEYDVLVVGGGMAGLAAAREAGASGAKVLLMEQTANFGGRLSVDGALIDGKPSADWIAQTITDATGIVREQLDSLKSRTEAFLAAASEA